MDRIKPQVTSDLINSLPDSTSTLPTPEHANQMENLILHQESPKPYLGKLMWEGTAKECVSKF